MAVVLTAATLKLSRSPQCNSDFAPS